MNNKSIINCVIDHPADAAVLFKPVQLQVIEKTSKGIPLNETEKRYLRGNLGKKITALEHLLQSGNSESSPINPLLDNLNNYYVTGFEALKHNGFGWFFNTNTIIVMNTSLKGSIQFNGKKFVFIRTRSMKGRSRHLDASSGMYIATNEQIIKDAFELKDESLIRTWRSMLERYGTMFVDYPERYQGPNNLRYNSANVHGVGAEGEGVSHNEPEEDQQ